MGVLLLVALILFVGGIIGGILAGDLAVKLLALAKIPLLSCAEVIALTHPRTCMVAGKTAPGPLDLPTALSGRECVAHRVRTIDHRSGQTTGATSSQAFRVGDGTGHVLVHPESASFRVIPELPGEGQGEPDWPKSVDQEVGTDRSRVTEWVLPPGHTVYVLGWAQPGGILSRPKKGHFVIATRPEAMRPDTGWRVTYGVGLVAILMIIGAVAIAVAVL